MTETFKRIVTVFLCLLPFNIQSYRLTSTKWINTCVSQKIGQNILQEVAPLGEWVPGMILKLRVELFVVWIQGGVLRPYWKFRLGS